MFGYSVKVKVKSEGKFDLKYGRKSPLLTDYMWFVAYLFQNVNVSLHFWGVINVPIDVFAYARYMSNNNQRAAKR